jgi:hypothetical protein
MTPLHLSDRPRYVLVFKYLMYVFVSSVLCWFCLLIRIGVLKELAAAVLRVRPRNPFTM